jgi:hypothetical protein
VELYLYALHIFVALTVNLRLYDGLNLETANIVIPYHEKFQKCIIRIFVSALVQL